MIQAFLELMTGQDWVVRVTLADVEMLGEYLTVKAHMNMSILKSKIGAKPVPLVVPTPKTDA